MNVLLIGCGNIGKSLLDVWVQLKLAKRIVVVDPNVLKGEGYMPKRFREINFVSSGEQCTTSYMRTRDHDATKDDFLKGEGYMPKRFREINFVSSGEQCTTSYMRTRDHDATKDDFLKGEGYIPKGFREINFVSSGERPECTTSYMRTRDHDETKDDFLKGEGYTEFVQDIGSIPQNFSENITVLAVKPQNLSEIAPSLMCRKNNSMVASVLAGTSISKLSSMLPNYSKIVRIMPNMAIKVRKSINLMFAPRELTMQETSEIETLFLPSGKIFWLPDEVLIDLLTPISGSGPAYFFLLAELLVNETIKVVENEELAQEIVQTLFLGSARLVEGNNDYKSLITAVASKKGVTEAALQKMQPGMKKAVQAGIAAAVTRLKKLAHENSS